jgi:hypothetical protein
MSNPVPASDLVKQTLRTVIVLVTACVLFVGALSGAAVAITSRAFASRSESTSDETTATKPAKSAKSEKSEKPDTAPAKKPQSI